MTQHLLEWARRRACEVGGENAIVQLRGGRQEDAVATSTGLTLASVEGIASGYSFLRDRAERRVCVGTACAFPGGVERQTAAPGAPVHCLGRCYEAPVQLGVVSHHAIPRRSLNPHPIVLRNILGSHRQGLEERYRLPDASAIIEQLTTSGLRGRGGAAFPTGAKWLAARKAIGSIKYVVANGDEGDPGAFIDRLLLEEDPHAVLAGMNACAKAIGASHGIVYIRAEYPRAAESVRIAIAEAKRANVLIPGFEVKVHVGAGAYVAGEETALLRAIEGLRAEPSPKPPYPAERGLYEKPTVVQNIETLAVAPWVIATGRRPHSKGFSLSGAVHSPGIVEADLGIRLSDLLARGGGGEAVGRRFKMALIGGPMGRVLSAAEFSTRLDYETLPGLGHAGIVVLDECVPARALAEHLFEFARSESCGSCAPCRIGTAQLARVSTRHGLERLLETLEMGSACGFGQGVPRPLRDLVRLFPAEMFAS